MEKDLQWASKKKISDAGSNQISLDIHDLIRSRMEWNSRNIEGFLFSKYTYTYIQQS